MERDLDSVGHTPGEVDDRNEARRPADSTKIDEWLEFIPSILMALAVVLTAYSAYEATRWGGVQSTSFATAGSLRTEAASLTTIGATEVSYDASAFAALLLEYGNADLDDPTVAAEVRTRAERLFRDEAVPAVEEWIRLNPRENPGARNTPLDLPSYRNANLEEADRLVGEAELRFQEAKEANQNGDDYILGTIVFASVLFFTGIRVKAYWLRSLVQGFAVLCLIAGIIWLLTLPFY